MALLGGLQYDCNSSITRVESVGVELLNRMLVIVIQSSCLITNLLTLSSRKYLLQNIYFLVYSYGVQKCGCYQCEFYHDYTEVASNRIFQPLAYIFIVRFEGKKAMELVTRQSKTPINSTFINISRLSIPIIQDNQCLILKSR